MADQRSSTHLPICQSDTPPANVLPHNVAATPSSSAWPQRCHLVAISSVPDLPLTRGHELVNTHLLEPGDGSGSGSVPVAEDVVRNEVRTGDSTPERRRGGERGHDCPRKLERPNEPAFGVGKVAIGGGLDVVHSASNMRTGDDVSDIRERAACRSSTDVLILSRT